jgi:thioesterase domain-containing protein
VEVYTVPGNHIVLLSEPYIKTFAQQLQACLERAQTSLKNDHHSTF